MPARCSYIGLNHTTILVSHHLQYKSKMSPRQPPSQRATPQATDNRRPTIPPQPVAGTSNANPTPSQLQQARLRQPPGLFRGLFSCHQPHSDNPNPISQNLREFTIRGQNYNLITDYLIRWLGYQAGPDTLRAMTARPGQVARIVEVIRHDPVQPAVYYFVEDLWNSGALVRVYHEDGHPWRQQGLELLSCALLKCVEHNISWEVNVMG